jgi:NAD(P)-dependent dehydrogenase (short-subunit alcohol dehydrogenase family)
MDIRGVAAIVTGGASGLGEATARRLAAAGARVAILDRDEARGARVAAELGGAFARCDVAAEDSVEAALAAAAAAQGEARIAVNCAGIVVGRKTVARDRATGAVAPHDLADFARVVSVNLVGTFLVASRAAARMAALEPVGPDGERGVVVMTSSIAAEDGQMGQLAYAASKGGVASMALPMARDLAREGVRVLAIQPGLFHTPMFDSLTPEVRAALAASVPFPSRLGAPDEFAALVEHVCRNPMLNGCAIRLDGAIRLAPR